MSQHGFNNLSDEIVLRIFAYLGARDLCRNAQVSVPWYRLANDPFLWKQLFLSRFGDAGTDRSAPLLGGGLRRRKWRELYAVYSNWRRCRCDCFEVAAPAHAPTPPTDEARVARNQDIVAGVHIGGGSHHGCGDSFALRAPGCVAALELSSGGAFLAAVYRDRPFVRVWNFQRESTPLDSAGDRAPLTPTSLAPIGHLSAVTNDRRTTTPTTPSMPTTPTPFVVPSVTSSVGAATATADDGHVDVACPAQPRCLTFGSGHSRDVLAVGMEGGLCALWSLGGARIFCACAFATEGDDAAVSSIRTREGAVVTLSEGGHVRVWMIKGASPSLSVVCVRVLRSCGSDSPALWDVAVSRVRRPWYAPSESPAASHSPTDSPTPATSGHVSNHVLLGGRSSWAVGVSRVATLSGAVTGRRRKRDWDADAPPPPPATHIIGLQTLTVDSSGAVAWERNPLRELGVPGEVWLSTAAETSGRTRVLCIASDARGGSARRVAWGLSDNSIGVWDASLGTGVAMLYGHMGAVTCLRFERERIISGSADRSIKIWSLPSGLCEHTIPFAHGCALSTVAFDERRIVTGDVEGGIKVWDFGARTSAALSYGGGFTPRRYLQRQLQQLQPNCEAHGVWRGSHPRHVGVHPASTVAGGTASCNDALDASLQATAVFSAGNASQGRKRRLSE
eukprot:Opistho-2@79021